MVCQKKGSYKFLIFIMVALFAGLTIAPTFGLHSSAYAEPKISQQSVDILSKTGQAIAEIVEGVKPAIVNISTTRTVKVQRGAESLFGDPFFRRFFGEEAPFRF